MDKARLNNANALLSFIEDIDTRIEAYKEFIKSIKHNDLLSVSTNSSRGYKVHSIQVPRNVMAEVVVLLTEEMVSLKKLKEKKQKEFDAL